VIETDPTSSEGGDRQKRAKRLKKNTHRGYIRRKEMKIVVIDGSPAVNNDDTSLVLTPFLEGMREAGAKVTLFNTEKLNIKPCRGCNQCLYKTPGECFTRDDMQVVLSELSQAEVWVSATPLTSGRLSAPMKRLVDRLLPLAKPTVEIRLNPTHHLKKLVDRLLRSTKPTSEIRDDPAQDRSREGTQAGKLVLVSSCDNGELGDFDPLVQQMQPLSAMGSSNMSGSAGIHKSRPTRW
jgi:hypothetical protein